MDRFIKIANEIAINGNVFKQLVNYADELKRKGTYFYGTYEQKDDIEVSSENGRLTLYVHPFDKTFIVDQEKFDKLPVHIRDSIIQNMQKSKRIINE